jgi:hemerythrin
MNLASFTHFLKDWILSHIAVMDKQYFKFLKSIATRKANGKLSVTREDIAC